jgi:hypothetical protein
LLLLLSIGWEQEKLTRTGSFASAMYWLAQMPGAHCMDYSFLAFFVNSMWIFGWIMQKSLD